MVTSEDLAGKNLILVLEGLTLDQIEFYIAHDDQIVWQETLGDSVSFDEIALPYRIPVLAFDLAQQDRETRIYFRIRSQVGIEVPLQITSAEGLAKDSQSLLAFFSGLFAFLSLCFALCTVLYYIMRERQFITYTLFFWLGANFLSLPNRYGPCLVLGSHGKLEQSHGIHVRRWLDCQHLPHRAIPESGQCLSRSGGHCLAIYCARDDSGPALLSDHSLRTGESRQHQNDHDAWTAGCSDSVLGDRAIRLPGLAVGCISGLLLASHRVGLLFLAGL